MDKDTENIAICKQEIQGVLVKYNLDLVTAPPKFYVTSDGTVKIMPAEIHLVKRTE